MKEMKEAIALFCILLVLTLPVGVADALSISNIDLEVSDRYAIVNWETDEASNSLVHYDVTNVTLALQGQDSVLKTNHSLMLTNLIADTKYYYSVESSNPNGTVVDNNSGAYHEFMTDLVDTTPPFIIADIPEYNAGALIDIEVSTEPDSIIFLYVNNNLTRFYNGSSFTFPSVRLESGLNTIKIITRDPSFNENEESFNVFADTAPPDVTYSPAIKKAYTTLSVTFSGSVTDNSGQPVSMWFYIDGSTKPNATIANLSSPWSTTLDFKTEGYHDLKIVAKDVAGVEYSNDLQDIWFDTTPLRFNNTNLNELSPAYTLFQTIRGNVNKPHAKIIAKVNNETTSGTFTTSLQDLIRSLAAGEMSFDTEADENGDFSLEIRLSQEPKYQVRSAEDVPAEASSSLSYIDFTTGRFWMNDVELIVIDEHDLWNSTEEEWVAYTKCGSGGQWRIDGPNAPTPPSLPEPIFREGFAQFHQEFKLKWNGGTPRQDVDVHHVEVNPRVELTRQTGERLDLERELFEGVKLFPSAPPYGESFYLTYDLAPLTEKLEGDYKWYDIQELSFPVQLEVEYSYEKAGGRPSGTLTQIECWEVNIQIERTIPPDHIPENFLKGMVKFFNGSINLIDKILKPLKTIKTYAYISCFATWPVYFVMWVRARFSCFGIGSDKVEEYCAMDADGEMSVEGDNPPTGMQTCCNAVGSQLNKQKWMNLFCDRVFCPSVPSLSHHVDTYSDAITRRGSSECNGWQGLDKGSDQYEKCKREFNRAWGDVFIIDYPFEDEFQAARVAAGLETGRTGIFASIFKNVGGFATNVCSRRHVGEEQIYYPEGTKATDKEVRGNQTVNNAFRINPDGSVNVGNVKIIRVYRGGKWQEDTTQFTATGNILVVTPEGCCGTSCSKPDGTAEYTRCSKAVTGFGTPPKADVVRLPNYVQNARGVKATDKYILNPTRGPIAATKAGCIPAVYSYLTVWRGLMDVGRTCFQSILKTGEGDSGVCQTFIGQVACDLIIDVLSCAKNIINKGGVGISGEKARTANPLTKFFSAVASGGDEIERTISGRYGETNVFRTAFTERKLIHSVCLAAFTGDWDMDIMADILGEAFEMPVDSIGSVFPADRRFMGSNPLDFGRTNYIYHAGVLLSAGADLNYEVQLVCSKSNDCARYSEESNPGGRCDCFYKEDERTFTVKSGSLEQGEMLNEDIYETIEGSDFRYDHARLIWRYTDSNDETVPGKKETFLSQRGIEPPAKCELDIDTGNFRCSFDVADQGVAYFVDGPRPANPDTVYSTGNPLNLETKIEVISPEGRQLTKFIGFIVRNQNKRIVYPNSRDGGVFQLDEGEKTYSFPGSVMTLREDDFGSADIERVAARTSQIQVKDNLGYVVATNPTSNFAVVFIDTSGKYACVDTTIINDGIQLLGGLPTTSTTTYTPGTAVRCKGLSFTIMTAHADIKITELKANQIYDKGSLIEFRPPTTTSVGQCSPEQVQWNVTATLYYGTRDGNTNTWSSTGTPVRHQGRKQEKSVLIPAKCVHQPSETDKPAITGFKVTPDEIKLDTERVDFEATVIDASRMQEVILLVNGERTKQAAKGDNNLWSGSISIADYVGILKSGNNEFNITARDSQGNVRSVTTSSPVTYVTSTQ
ncbi:hypothetical protein ACFLZ7_01210 [Nanoarchaeota archaeon]